MSFLSIYACVVWIKKWMWTKINALNGKDMIGDEKTAVYFQYFTGYI